MSQVASAGAPELRRYGLAQIRAVFNRAAILRAVGQAFVDHASGRFMNARPTHMLFPEGVCHVKCGHMIEGESISIKVSAGFYANERFGLPNFSGLILVLDQRTGFPIALLEDAGWLTAWRTVAACVIAVQIGQVAEPLKIGIVGAGLQAALAAEWLSATVSPASVRIWARSPEKAHQLACRIGEDAQAESDLATLCQTCNIIVTATPSRQPLIMSKWVRAGTHIVALGADTPGKIEVDPDLFRRATTIITDDHLQCLGHGDFGSAVRAGAVGATTDVSIGSVLNGAVTVCRDAQAISIVDLTGLAAQDDAISRLVLEQLRNVERDR